MTPAATAAAPDLESLHGVGPGLARRIRARFGNDAAFFDAVERSDIAAVATVDGLSERRAVDLVRRARGGQAHRFLATRAARRIHEGILERLQACAATAHGRNRLRLLSPLPDPATARAHAEGVARHRTMVEGLDRTAVRRLLGRLKPLADPAPRFDPGRLVVAGDEATLERLREGNVHRWASVDGPRGLRRADEHELVVLVGLDHMAADTPDHCVALPEDASAAEAAPEAVLAWATHNRGALEAMAGLARLLGRPSRAAEALEALDGAPATPRGTAGLQAIVQEVARTLDEDLRRRVAAIRLTGEEALEALGHRMPKRIQAEVDHALREGRRLLRARCGVDLQPFLPSIPLGVDDEEVARVEAQRAASAQTEAFHGRAAAARTLAGLRPGLQEEAQAWLEWDVHFALGCFAHRYRLEPPAFGDALQVESSMHLDLCCKKDAQPVDYRLGGDTRVALLTGANSGGKSTLLEHLAQLAVLARLGLGVPGRHVALPWTEEVHLVTARRGLDAGAFETFLRTFLPLADSDRKRLVLVDEVEAVTEPGAAARLLGFFCRRMADSGSLAIIVTHMAPQVLEHTGTAPVRVDGIEATGLDAENRLVVDRCPRLGHHARSTPELIVARLAATARGREAQVYEELLAAMRRGTEAGKGRK